jgi:hypothetical protein
VAFDTGSIGVVGILEKNCTNFDPLLNESTYNQNPCFKNEFTYDPDFSKTGKRTGMICKSPLFTEFSNERVKVITTVQ